MSFLGAIVRMRIRLADGVVVVLDVFNDPTLELPALDAAITVSFPTEGPLVLEPDAGSEPGHDRRSLSGS